PWRIRGSAACTIKMAIDSRHERPLDPEAIGTRTLLLWGEADRIVPLRIAHDLHRRLPDARLEVLPRAGHLPLEEQPAAATETIERFLAEPLTRQEASR